MTRIRFPAAPLLLPAALLLPTLGCESLPSDEVGTESIWADFAATSDGESTHATGVLRVGGATSNTFVNLEGGDVLTATAGGETKEMLEGYLGDLFIYDIDFDLFAEDEAFVFAFEREIETSAPDSHVTLPALFAITAPAADAVFSRSADSLTVSWDPSGEQDQMVVEVQGDCIWNEHVTVTGDPGTVTIEAGSIDSLDQESPSACEGEVVVKRIRTGSLDAAYGEGGTVFGTQERRVPVRIDP